MEEFKRWSERNPRIELKAAPRRDRPRQPSPDPIEGRWRIVRIDGVSPPAYPAILTFQGGRFGGRPICNSLSGSYWSKGPALNLSEMFHTVMATATEAMTRERRLFELLADVRRFRRQDGRLVFVTYEGLEVELVAEPEG